MKKEKRIYILGGGPAGMAAAMELSKQDIKSEIIEKSSKIGGLSKTLEFKEGEDIFRTDIGPHRFFSKNQYLYDFIEDLLAEKWITVNRQTRQLIAGNFYDYPIKAWQALKNIGLLNSILIVLSYIKAVIVYKVFKKKIVSFDDYIVSNFGRKLGEFNMLNYTEKIWGINCRKIHPDWAKQRIKGLNLLSALREAIFNKNKKNSPKTLIDQFYYPQFGTGLIYETIAKEIKNRGSVISTNSEPSRIIIKNNNISEIEIKTKEGKRIVYPDKVISSIPITSFIKKLSPSPPSEVFQAAANLKWRSQVYLFITLNKKRVTDDNWIYFPDKEIPFARIAEMKNFSQDMSPADKTSLFVEFFVTDQDEIWKKEKREIMDLAMEHFRKLNLFSESEIRHFYVFKKKYVYPVYDLNYHRNLEIIKNYLDKIENLIYIGRPGRFKYTNQDHSLEMGILAALSIIENKKQNFDDIGEENEYFESGYVKK